MKRLFFATAIALGLASCASNQQAVITGEWKVLTINGNELPNTTNEPVLNINADKTFYGVTGINRISGEYNLTGNAIQFSDGPMTKMSGDPESMEVEINYIKAISSAKTVENNNGNLILKDADGKEVMKLGKK